MTSLVSPNVGGSESGRPLVSIVLPTQNRPDTLREALQSIVAQTYREIETIVVNDGGLDVSYVLSDFNSKCNIRYLSHAVRKGPAAARNTALKVARGQYIAYLDDDDLYYPYHVETLVECLESSGCQVAYTDSFRAEQEKHESLLGDCRIMRSRASVKTILLYSMNVFLPALFFRLLYRLASVLVRDWYYEFLSLNDSAIDMFSRSQGKYFVVTREVLYSFDFNYEELLNDNYLPILCVMHRKSCLDDVGVFDESLDGHEDWDFWIRMGKIFNFAHVRKLTCEFAWRIDGTTTTSGNRQTMKRTRKLVAARYATSNEAVGKPSIAPGSSS